jgi:anti-sigma B factor antagonist
MFGCMSAIGRRWRAAVRRLQRRLRRRPIVAPRDSPQPFTVEASETSFGAMVIVAGEVDLATAPRLRDVLGSHVAPDGESVALDLSGVTFIDSVGLALVLALDRELRLHKGRMAIVCPEGPAKLLFEVTGVDAELALYPTRAAAVEALERPSAAE